MAEIDTYQAMVIREGDDDFGGKAAVIAHAPGTRVAATGTYVPSTGEIAVVAPSDVERIARALYRAAGLSEPIILDRPDEGEAISGEIYADGGHVEVEVHGCYAPGPARRLAAFIAHTADEAERVPDRDEVAALAKLLHDADTALPVAEPVCCEMAIALLRTHTVTPREENR